MKVHAFRKTIMCLASLALASCNLDRVTVATPLREGVRYEVRRAVDSREQFDPYELRSIYFVLKPQDPPYIAGTRNGAQGCLSVRATAYCHSEADHTSFGRKSAIGRPLKFGAVRSVAADWSRYPLGTQFRIKGQPGVLYEVDDYGSALVGTNTIDLYQPSRTAMNRWGVRNVDIEVVKWGSFTDSLETMKDRIQFAHVRQMVREIQFRGLNNLAQKPEFRSTTPVTATTPPPMLARVGTSFSM